MAIHDTARARKFPDRRGFQRRYDLPARVELACAPAGCHDGLVKRALAWSAGFGIFVCAVAFGCSDSTGTENPAPLPDRGGDAAAPATDSGVSCTNVTFSVSDTPACDQCAKDKCCAEVLACSASADCKGLQDCIAPCASTDFQCILTCQSAHDKGSGLLQDLGSCAQSSCKAECPDNTPDADLFGDAF
jgi:hypothetical protein